jgi:hypothetical protein
LALQRTGFATAQLEGNITAAFNDNGANLFWTYENETCFLSTVLAAAAASTEVETDVRSGCWNGTGLLLDLKAGNSSSDNKSNPALGTVSGLFGSVPVFYTNVTYQLKLTIQVDIREVLMSRSAGGEASAAQDEALPLTPNQPGVFVGFVRLVLCNALQIGACDIFRGRSGADDDGGGLSTHIPADQSSGTNEFVNVLYGRASGYSDAIDPDLAQIQNKSTHCTLDLTAGDRNESFVSSPWLAIALYSAATDSSHSHSPSSLWEERVYRTKHGCTVWISPDVTSGVRLARPLVL